MAAKRSYRMEDPIMVYFYLSRISGIIYSRAGTFYAHPSLYAKSSYDGNPFHPPPSARIIQVFLK
jgi:hypothetical protein